MPLGKPDIIRTVMNGKVYFSYGQGKSPELTVDCLRNSAGLFYI